MRSTLALILFVYGLLGSIGGVSAEEKGKCAPVSLRIVDPRELTSKTVVVDQCTDVFEPGANYWNTYRVNDRDLIMSMWKCNIDTSLAGKGKTLATMKCFSKQDHSKNNAYTSAWVECYEGSEKTVDRISIGQRMGHGRSYDKDLELRCQ